jgi:uncharacterized membrane protein
MRVEETTVVNAPREAVWEYMTDPAKYPLFFAGITRWDVEGRKRRGLGARYRLLMHVGSADVGGLIEIVEFDEPGDMAWTSVMGIEQRGRWRLRERGPNRTLVTFRLSYSAPGGLLGWLSDQFSAPLVRRNLKATVDALKRQVETGEAERAARSRKRTPSSSAAKKRAGGTKKRSSAAKKRSRSRG